MSLTWASHAYDEKSTFLIVFKHFLLFSTIQSLVQACVPWSKYTTFKIRFFNRTLSIYKTSKTGMGEATKSVKFIFLTAQNHGFLKSFFYLWWHLVAFIDHYTHLYKIVRHQLSYMQLYNIQHAYNLLQNTRYYHFCASMALPAELSWLDGNRE